MMPLNNEMMFYERKGSAFIRQYVYTKDSPDLQEVTVNKQSSGRNGKLEKFLCWFRDVFLPQGYPESVSGDYIEYQLWDTCQAYCSSIADALSLQATLTGLGVGQETATPLAATLTWLLKDGSGMLSSISFAYWKSSQLDSNCKQWRLFADVANDTAMLMRLLAPILPVPFMAMMCASAVMTSLVGVAGRATRAALTLHQSQRGNMADVAAKDGSQETLVNLAALITSLTILPIITHSQFMIWLTFVCCVCGHLFANHKAVRAVVMTSLNRPRLLHVMKFWFSENGAVPDVKEANRAEPLLIGAAFLADFFPYGFRVKFGCSMSSVLHSYRGNLFLKDEDTDISSLMDDNFMIVGNLEERQMYVIYGFDITPMQELKAFFTTYFCIINYIHLNKDLNLRSDLVALNNLPKTNIEFIANCKTLATKLFPEFLTALNAMGWDSSQLFIDANEFRIEFSREKQE